MIEKFHYNTNLIRRILDSNSIPIWNENVDIEYITTSSKEVEKNSLFVPLLGVRDGHEFIPDALLKGAVAFLCKKEHPILDKLSFLDMQKAIPVEDTLLALGKLAEFHSSRFRPFTIAITGSSGKTTAKELLACALSHLEEKEIAVTEKNYNNEIGLPFTIFRVNSETKLLICEMGMNHSGEITRLSKMAKPNVSMITNIGPAHIENLKSVKNIAKAKSEIIEGMQTGGTLFFPNNILYKKIIKKKCKKHNVLIQPYKLEDDIKIEATHKWGYSLKIQKMDLEWKLPGGKILETLSGIIAIIKFLKIEISKSIQNLQNFITPSGRIVLKKGYYNLIDDTYNANPDSMLSSLGIGNQVSSGEFYAILGDMKELGNFSKKYHKEVGRFCAELRLKGLITYGTDAEYIGKEYEKRYTKGQTIHFPQKEDILSELQDWIKVNIPQNSTILLKGSRSMKMENIVQVLERMGNARE